MRLGDTVLKQLFLDARTHRAWLPQGGSRQRAEGGGRPHEDGPHLLQLPAGAHRVREVEGGQGAAEAAPERGQRRQDHGGAGHARSSATTSKFYRASAEGPGPARRVRGQAGAGADGGAAQRLAAGRLFHPGGAGAWPRLSGRMSGFDNAGVDKEFFAGTDVKSNFLCNVGYGDPAALRPRGPRFAFDEIAQII